MEAQRGKRTNSMPHSSVAGIRIQVPSPQPRALFAVASSMCVSTEVECTGRKMWGQIKFAAGVMVPSSPAVLGCQTGIPGQHVAAFLARTSRCPAVRVVAGPGILLPQPRACVGGVLIFQGCSLNVSTGHRAREILAQPDPAAKTAPLHQTQLLPRSSGGLRAVVRPTYGLSNVSSQPHRLPGLKVSVHVTGILWSQEKARWREMVSGLGNALKGPGPAVLCEGHLASKCRVYQPRGPRSLE